MQKFSNIAGHEFAKKLILSSLEKNKIAHAYLFAGPEAVGKFRFAIEFAKIIQCGADYAASADEKIISRAEKIESGADPDVLLFDNLSSENIESEDESGARKIISVGDIRKIEHYLNLSSYYSKYKIAIIRNAHLLTVEAANAFLKTMEEPRGDSVIILIADNINFLPKTLISRVQLIRFGTAREEIISGLLKQKGASDEEAVRITGISGGKAGVALDFLKNSEKLQSYIDNKKEWQKFINGNLNERFSIIEKILEKEGRGADVLDLWLEHSRNCLVGKYLLRCRNTPMLCIGDEGELKGIGGAETSRKIPALIPRSFASGSGSFRTQAISVERENSPSAAVLVKFIGKLKLVLTLMKTSNVNRKLALENLALEV